MTDDSTRLAVLIDADNTSPKLTKEMFEELASYGTITVKRAYGDWTNPHLTGWREVLLGNAISPQQQFAYTSGKNATDSALIIDAMDLLYSGNVEGFAIVSSDSDFTPLATRLRESGKRVIGVGRRKTPKAFVEACERFVFLEVLANEGGDGATTEQAKEPAAEPAAERATEPAKDDQSRPIQSVLTKALNRVDTDDEDWASLERARKPHLPHRPLVRLAHLRVRQAQRPGQGAALRRDEDGDRAERQRDPVGAAQAATAHGTGVDQPAGQRRRPRSRPRRQPRRRRRRSRPRNRRVSGWRRARPAAPPQR